MPSPYVPAPAAGTFAEPLADAQAPFETGLRLVDRHAHEGSPREFAMFDLRWDLLPGVFAPVHTDSTELFTAWLPFPVGGKFLEVGCGAGVTAVVAALAGCAHVTAVDITAEAVHNTEVNAARHGVGDRVRAVRSDLFDALAPGERFDLVFWNSNVVPAPDEFVYDHGLQHAIFDRGYSAHRRYLSDGLTRLTEAGRLFLGFNSLGDLPRLTSLATASGTRITARRDSARHTSDVPVTFQLLEITADPGNRAAT
ncbi:methyltransferase [Streptomyces mayonensis]|uniref:methyltransferase n=1 Tax=Streptomyces mayonensis TaxID=2750816 RepID=UPI001C1E4DDF|nr:methyltransferase [Streptomyces sp. A108]MBU6530289.1 methyltransferase [Streptomyces sp. A108]